MIVCGNFTEDYLTRKPVLIVKNSSQSTKLRDRNTKYNLYQLQGVKYYIIADTEKKIVEVFEMTGNSYLQKTNNTFHFTTECIIDFNVYNLWLSM